LEAIRAEALAEEIELYMVRYDLLMIDERETKDLGGREVTIHRLSFYRRSTYDDKPTLYALYDMGDLYQNITEWRFDYPLWDRKGQAWGERPQTLGSNIKHIRME